MTYLNRHLTNVLRKRTLTLHLQTYYYEKK